MHLILGVDDSPCSKVAVEFVRGMTWPAGTTATVVCALPQVVMAVPEAYLMMAQEMEGARREQRGRDQRDVDAIAAGLTARGVAAKGVVEDGDPRLALIDVARREHADLVVVGSHGRTGLPKLVLGSVASHVTTHAPCSVLVVREPARKGGGS
jgi:nucleotide-binding universal stress UspA family protein